MYALLFGYLAASGKGLSLSECARFMAALYVVSLACFFLYVVFLDEVQQALETAGSSVHRIARIGGWCLLAIALLMGSGASFWLIAGNPSPHAHVSWQILVAASVLMPAMLVCPAIALTADRKRREEWENLILDG